MQIFTVENDPPGSCFELIDGIEEFDKIMTVLSIQIATEKKGKSGFRLFIQAIRNRQTGML